MLGRDFTPADNAAGARRSRSSATASGSATSAASPQIVGKAVRINGKPATIIGVMPKGLRVPAERGAVAAALQRVPAESA
jgi:hypothetical protein